MALQKTSASLDAVVARIVPENANEFFQALSSATSRSFRIGVKYFDKRDIAFASVVNRHDIVRAQILSAFRNLRDLQLADLVRSRV